LGGSFPKNAEFKLAQYCGIYPDREERERSLGSQIMGKHQESSHEAKRKTLGFLAHNGIESKKREKNILVRGELKPGETCSAQDSAIAATKKKKIPPVWRAS